MGNKNPSTRRNVLKKLGLASGGVVLASQSSTATGNMNIESSRAPATHAHSGLEYYSTIYGDSDTESIEMPSAAGIEWRGSFESPLGEDNIYHGFTGFSMTAWLREYGFDNEWETEPYISEHLLEMENDSDSSATSLLTSQPEDEDMVTSLSPDEDSGPIDWGSGLEELGTALIGQVDVYNLFTIASIINAFIADDGKSGSGQTVPWWWNAGSESPMGAAAQFYVRSSNLNYTDFDVVVRSDMVEGTSPYDGTTTGSTYVGARMTRENVDPEVDGFSERAVTLETNEINDPFIRRMTEKDTVKYIPPDPDEVEVSSETL